MKLDHINIKANPELLDQVKNFYCDLLGFEVGPRPNVTQHGYWLYSEEKAQIHLMATDEVPHPNQDGHLDHIAFTASQITAMISKLKAANVKYTSHYLADYDLAQLFIFDPTGNKLRGF